MLKMRSHSLSPQWSTACKVWSHEASGTTKGTHVLWESVTVWAEGPHRDFTWKSMALGVAHKAVAKSKAVDWLAGWWGAARPECPAEHQPKAHSWAGGSMCRVWGTVGHVWVHTGHAGLHTVWEDTCPMTSGEGAVRRQGKACPVVGEHTLLL